jgi:hypothetical protein
MNFTNNGAHYTHFGNMIIMNYKLPVLLGRSSFFNITNMFDYSSTKLQVVFSLLV